MWFLDLKFLLELAAIMEGTARFRISCAPAGSGRLMLKSKDSYRMRQLLTQRRNLKRKFFHIENAIRHSIKTFGLKVGSRRGSASW